jgi:hypothetical protein
MSLDNLPSADELLFRDDLPDWQNNACVAEADDLAIKEGYKRAARHLALTVVENGREQDFLIYPVVFLYRHYIELALKSTLTRMDYLLDKERSKAVDDHLGNHRIDWLWNDLKPLLDEVCEAANWSKLDENLVGSVDALIGQIHEVDAASYAFRYARQKKTHKPSLPKSFKRVNIRHLSDVMEKLCDFLETLDDSTAQLSQDKAESENEWQ